MQKKSGRKTSPRTKKAEPMNTAQAAANRTGEVLRDTWKATREAIGTAEGQLEKQVRGLEKQVRTLQARLEKEVRSMLKSRKITAKEASALVGDVRSRIETERKRAYKELDQRVKSLQTRVKKERKAAARVADDAVRGALAALNIPSRQEVADLTRKVDELSRKIDAFRAGARKRTRTAAAPVAAA